MKRKHSNFFTSYETSQRDDIQENKKKTCIHNEDNIVGNNDQKNSLIEINNADSDHTSTPSSRETTPEYYSSTPPSSPPREVNYSDTNLPGHRPKLNRINTISIWSKPVDRSDSQLTQAEWNDIDNYLREKEEQEHQRAWDEMKNAKKFNPY